MRNAYLADERRYQHCEAVSEEAGVRPRASVGPWAISQYGIAREHVFNGIRSVELLNTQGGEPFTDLLEACQRMLGTFCTSAKCEGDEEVIRFAREAVKRAKGKL